MADSSVNRSRRGRILAGSARSQAGGRRSVEPGRLLSLYGWAALAVNEFIGKAKRWYFLERGDTIQD